MVQVLETGEPLILSDRWVARIELVRRSRKRNAFVLTKSKPKPELDNMVSTLDRDFVAGEFHGR